MTNQILWKTNTTIHDWKDGDFVGNLLDRATQMGLLGSVSWLKAGIKGERLEKHLEKPSVLIENLPEPLPDEPANSYLEAGGEQPFPWTVKLSISPFEEKRNKVKTLSTAWVFFDKQAVSSIKGTQELIKAFTEVHNPGNTEYALIHPYQHWLDLADQYYRIPVTIGSMFKGIFWANFLGPGHLNEFDLEKLADISAYRTKWIEDQGLFLISSPSILEAEENLPETECILLTKLFRDAVRLESKWR